MIIGVPKEIKDNEFRVALVPSGAGSLVRDGHTVIVEEGAGGGSSIEDEEYEKAGAEIATSPREVFEKADIVIKVKEPMPEEYPYLRDGLVLFTFLHLAAKKELTEELLKSRVTAIGYETVKAEAPSGGPMLPILKPMSEIAGRLAVQVGAYYLLRPMGGSGVLIGGIPGVGSGKVLILGAGTVGVNSARVAVGLGAEVTVIDIDTERFRYLYDLFGARVKTLMSTPVNIVRAALECDVLIGAVHVPGGKTPMLVPRELVGKMKKGSVVVDVAVDQGGSVETIRPTTHSEPVFTVDGVLHYGVSNMPGAVPRTSTYALTNVTLPYLMKLAALGLTPALKADPTLRAGVNTHAGRLTNPAVAVALDIECSRVEL